MTEPLRIGVAGLGTVGASLVRLLAQNGNALAHRCGRPVRVVAVSARDKSRDRGIDLSGIEWFDDPVAMAKSANVECVVELMGGADGKAKDTVEAALAAGKSVVTANKALLAKHERTRRTRRNHRCATEFRSGRGRWYPRDQDHA